MKFTLRPESRAEEDLFGPLRDLRSPISMETVKSVVFNRASAKFSLWNQLWSHLAEFLALGIVAAVAVNFSAFQGSGIGTHLNSGVSHSDVASNNVFFAVPASNTVPRSNSAHPFRSNIHTIDILAELSTIPTADTTKNILPVTRFRNDEATPIALTEIVGNSIVQSPLSSLSPSAGMMWYSTLSTGAVFSHLRNIG